MIGHGKLGLRSGLRDFLFLSEESHSAKDVFVELRPTTLVEGWALYSSGTYVTPYNFVYEGIRRDIVAMHSLVDANLTRVVSVADCEATVGTFYYDPDEEFGAQEVTEWDDTILPPWQLAAWKFDGASYLSRSTMRGALADGKTGTMSFWFRKEGASSVTEYIMASTSSKFIAIVRTNGEIQISARNSVGTIILILRSLGAYDDDGWHHVMGSWDLAAGNVCLYVDGVEDEDTGATIKTNDTIDYTVAAWSVGAYTTGVSPYTGDLAQIWLDGNRFFDLTSSTVRERFYTLATGTPMDFEYDGAKPIKDTFPSADFDVKPVVFLDQGINNVKENTGDGGDFNEVGTILDATTRPTSPIATDLWDQFPQLYVHLSDGSDVEDTTIIGAHGFYYSGAGATKNGDAQVHPALGPDILLIGDFETWNGTPTGWTRLGGSNGVTSKETTIVREGSSALRMDVDASEVEMWYELLDASDNFRNDKKVRFSGWYYTTGDADAQLTINDGTDGMLEDGRHTDTNPIRLTLERTGGEWRRFVFDFLPADLSLAANFGFGVEALGDGGTSGTVIFDGLKVQHVWRYNWYAPRVSSSSVPAVSTGSADIFFGGKTIGIGSVKLINSDGAIERMAAELEWMNQEVLVDVGGQFFDDDQEILVDDWFRGFTGLVQSLVATDEDFTFELQDQRIFFHFKLPPRLYDGNENPNMNFQRLGQSRPVFFGVKASIDPTRIDTNGSTAFGTYEICDTEKSPDGMKAVDTVYGYISAADAERRDSTKRVELILATDYSKDLSAGTISVLTDFGPYEITENTRYLDFNPNAGGEVTAILDIGMYTAPLLAAEIQTQMRAVGTTDETCSVSTSTHKFTIGKAAGSLVLMPKTGTNKDRSPWKLLGYATNADLSGSLSYEADNAVFSDSDKEHVLRVDAQGYKDDGSGTFTGVADALIESGSDITRTLLIKFMGKSSDIIDETSFQFARSRASESLSLYLKTSISTKDLFDRLEYSNIANIIVNGEGKVFYKVYVGTVPSDIVEIGDASFKKFASGESNTEVFTTIRVKYDEHPVSGIFEAQEATDESVAVRLGRPDIKEFDTFIKKAGNAQLAAQRMLELSKTAARIIEGEILGSRLMRLEVGDKIRATRRRGYARGGKIDNEIFRLLNLSKNPLSGIVKFIATDDRVTVASQSCITLCQSFCESTCQATCEQICQGECELLCQDTCESACQIACEQGCQSPCQLGCETTCEVNCQDTCQLACQGSCEGGGCQENCEHTCQSSCELTCQDSCEADCQGTCQLTCQDPCQLGCQQTCMLAGGGCQQACKIDCQDVCENSCQDTCEIWCESACQLECQEAWEEDW